MKLLILMTIALSIAFIGNVVGANAADKASSQTVGQAAGPGSSMISPKGTKDEPTRSIHFEDDVVEGMNTNPFDSIENVSINDGRDHGHLYHRKANFHKEMKSIVQEAGYSQ